MGTGNPARAFLSTRYTLAEKKVAATNLVAALPTMLEIPADERDLIERSNTDRDALSILYRKYLPTITAYVVRRVGNTQEAEDLVSNVFLAMVSGLPRY